MADDIYTKWLRKGFHPDDRLFVSEWADRYRKLASISAAEPGYWRTDRTPYLREIMDSLSTHSRVQEVVFMKGAQLGGTECGNNWVGYCIHHAPGPFLLVQPTVELAKRNSKQRIDPLIESSDLLSSLVTDPRSRDSGNTMLAKEFPGGILVMTGANSAVGLRSLPARYLFLDEVDAYPEDVAGEGDPLELARARTRTFSSRRKILMVSTPTTANKSKIERAYQDSDQRKFFVPCPLCHEYQTIEWTQIKWEQPDGSDAYLKCSHCERSIEEHHKTKMLDRGEWRVTNPEGAEALKRGYHLSSLYSPLGWLSWSECVRDFLKAQKSREKLRSFVNTILGETWQEKGEAPEWDRIYDRREGYKIGTVPEPVLFLTAAADIQKDRIEVEIKGWGRGKQSWSIEHRVFHGDPYQGSTWAAMDALLGEIFPGVDGVDHTIRCLAVDSGFATQSVYDWARRHPISRVIAIKGQEKLQVPINNGTLVDLKKGAGTSRKAFRVFGVGTDYLKAELYGLLQMKTPDESEPYPDGWCHFPEYDSEYFKQLTAEKLTEKMVRGYKRFFWEKIRERNEALDLHVYNRAAASYLRIDRMRSEHWDKMEGEKSLKKGKTRQEQIKKPAIKRKKNRWV